MFVVYVSHLIEITGMWIYLVFTNHNHTHKKQLYVRNAPTPHHLNYLCKDPSVGPEEDKPSRAERSGAERRQSDAGAAGRSSPGWLLRFVF